MYFQQAIVKSLYKCTGVTIYPKFGISVRVSCSLLNHFLDRSMVLLHRPLSPVQPQVSVPGLVQLSCVLLDVESAEKSRGLSAGQLWWQLGAVVSDQVPVAGIELLARDQAQVVAVPPLKLGLIPTGANHQDPPRAKMTKLK